MAEYEACILEIKMVVDMNIKECLVMGDSDLLIHQLQGKWTTKNVKNLPCLHCVKELHKKFIKIEFKHVPRIQNEFADTLATLSSMIQHSNKNYIDPIKIEVRDQHAYYFHVDEKLDVLVQPHLRSRRSGQGFAEAALSGVGMLRKYEEDSAPTSS
uniref:Uncharacterized protein Mb2253c-like n=1 Tax=Nicotiana tabacum TaxID=4097 RepID=A0A1S3YQY2_TOBAC|nr:PREDICTED: uncharacterized protein Mb2253c-like [Nicotiana tabacum]